MTVFSSPNYAREWKRSYEIWNHAETRLNASTNDEDRADVVSILRRVLNHRIRRLRKYYLDRLSFQGKPAGAIEQLELVGAAKPTMAHNLLKIRNSIEYQDRKPPTKKRCCELLEFVWYFLRSTDPLIASVANGIEAKKYGKHYANTPYGFELSFERETKWRMKISGNFESTDVSFLEKSGWLNVVTDKIERKNPQADEGFKENDLWIIGHFSTAFTQYVKVCRFYFSNPGT